MPPWATIVLTLGTTAIAVAGTLGATMLQHRFARRERLATEAAARRERASSILGPIETLLSDGNPSRLGINAGPSSPALLEELHTRWQPLRMELAGFAASHPDADVAFAATRLSVAVSNALISGRMLVSDLLNPPSGGGRRSMIEVARGDHQRAGDLLELVRDAVRGDLHVNLKERASEIECEADERENRVLDALDVQDRP